MSKGGFEISPLASVAPGARLAVAALGANGQVLLTAGTVLTEEALAGLAACGIAAVSVEPQDSEAARNAAHEALHQRLRYLFRRCDLESADGVPRLLFDAVLARRLKEIQ